MGICQRKRPGPSFNSFLRMWIVKDGHHEAPPHCGGEAGGGSLSELHSHVRYFTDWSDPEDSQMDRCETPIDWPELQRMREEAWKTT